ncbi:hypothetical protein FRC04_000410 [Tulasnella sp. 424]|nr:hypothetical protein FRC04_000410 [Tulasnella sp. 424]
MQQPPTPNPGVEAPVPIQPTLATSEPTYRHQIRITFPDLAKLAQAGRYSELAQACENLEAAIPDDPDACHLLLTGPLVLTHLINDDAASAYFALRRLPNQLAASPLPQVLLPLTASIADRKYQNIQPRISALISLAQNPQALEPELGLLIESMAVALQSMCSSRSPSGRSAKGMVTAQHPAAWKKRIVALLSRAYASIPVAQASALLGLPPDKIASEASSWKYDAANGTFTPVGDTATSSTQAPSSLARFDDAVAGAAQLESVF